MPSTTQVIDYFQNRSQCVAAAQSLRSGVRICVVMEHEQGTSQHFLFERIEKGNRVTVEDQIPESVDFTFTLPRKTMQELIELPSDNIGEIGVFVLKKMMTREDGDARIRFNIHCGVLTIMRNGYLGVLAQGGKAVAGFLAENGLSLSGIGGLLRKYKS